MHFNHNHFHLRLRRQSLHMMKIVVWLHTNEAFVFCGFQTEIPKIAFNVNIIEHNRYTIKTDKRILYIIMLSSVTIYYFNKWICIQNRTFMESRINNILMWHITHRWLPNIWCSWHTFQINTITLVFVFKLICKMFTKLMPIQISTCKFLEWKGKSKWNNSLEKLYY